MYVSAPLSSNAGKSPVRPTEPIELGLSEKAVSAINQLPEICFMKLMMDL